MATKKRLPPADSAVATEPAPPQAARKARPRAVPPASRGAPGELPPVESYRCADITPQTRVSRYFTVRELTVSDLAQRRGIDNRFDSDAHLQAAVHLARSVLDPLREHHGGPFSPNSVFRSQALERELKGRPGSWISTSQHTEGCACDVELPGLSTLDLARWAAANLQPFDQIICECYDAAEGVNSGWVHIARLAPGRGVNRGEQLSYVRDPKSGQWVYVTGFRGA